MLALNLFIGVCTKLLINVGFFFVSIALEINLSVDYLFEITSENAPLFEAAKL